MSYLIPLSELEQFSELELRSKFNQVVADLARAKKTAAECPLAMMTLENIRQALLRRRLQGPKP